jgi:uncharacterized delta-60 repeat protein
MSHTTEQRPASPLAEPLECRRLLSGGAPDPIGTAWAVVAQPDRKVVAGGSVEAPGGSTFGLARYTSSGKFDASFGGGDGIVSGGPPGATNAEGLDLVRQSDGKIVAVGTASVGGAIRFGVARYNTNGTPDRTFSGDGFVTIDVGPGSDAASAVAIDPRNGRIVVAGVADSFGSPDFAVVRLNTNGTLDSTFDGDGKRVVPFSAGSRDFASSVLVRSDGKIIVGGSRATPDLQTDFAVIRLNANGSLDTSWDGDGRATADFNRGTDGISDLAFGPGGTVVAVGFAWVNEPGTSEDAAFALARFTSRGMLDLAFGGGDGRVTTEPPVGQQGFWGAVAAQADGKLVTAGYNSFGEGDAVGIAARYLADGRLDPAFGGHDAEGTGFARFQDTDQAFIPRDVALQGSKLVFAGISRDNEDAPFHFAVARRNANGSRDTTFSPGPVDSAGTLRVIGTEEGETITVTRVGAVLRVDDGRSTRDVDAASVRRIEVRGLGGNDTLTIAGAGVPGTLLGGDGDDLLIGGSRGDVLKGEAGDDTLIGNAGGDDLSGGAGVDTLDYSAATGNLTIGLGSFADDGIAGEGDNARSDNENVIGGSGNDRITGTSAANVFRGNGGNDLLYGRGGNDTLFGGAGGDSLNGEDGNDVLHGEGDNEHDFLAGGFGTDTGFRDDGDVTNGVEVVR